MNTNKMMNLAYSKMVEAMALLKVAYEKADMEAADAEVKERHAANVLARFEYMYPVYEGNPSFEADMNTAQEVYDKASERVESLQCDVDKIDNIMISTRNAIDAIENILYYEELGCE